MMWGLLLAWASLSHASPILEIDFSADDGGLNSQNGLQWEWGLIHVGPAGFTGPAWATRTDGDYLNDAVDTLGLPPLDLSEVERPVLIIEHWYDIDESGPGDLGWVEVRGPAEASRLNPIHGYPSDQGYSGTSSGFRTDYFDLSGISDAADVQIVFEADEAVARSGWVISTLRIDDGDPVPPVIQEVSELPDTQDLNGPYIVHAVVSDDLSEPEAQVHWQQGTANPASAAMTHLGANLYRGEIPAMPVGSRIRWWIGATDGQNFTTWPTEGKARFDVFLAAPTDLSAPDARADGRVSGLEVALEWTAPDSPHPLVHTVVFRDQVRIGTALGTTTTVPINASQHTLTVAGVFDTPLGQIRGDDAASIDISVALPLSAPLQPSHGYQGDTLRLDVTGVNLLMSQDAVALTLGGGVSVTSLEVVDADRAIATVEIAADAAIQVSDAHILAGSSAIPIPDGFEIRDGTQRPQLVEISPRSIKQGSQATITLESNAPLHDTPVVDLGDGVVALSTEVDGHTLLIDVATTADAPIGDRMVTVDDGLRILDGVTLEVRDARPPPGRVCATSQGQPTHLWAPILAALLGLRRRKIIA